MQSLTLRAACCLFAVLAYSTAQAELLRVTAANSSGNLVYDVSFAPPPGSISSLNADGAKHGSFSAMVQVENSKTFTVDLLVADAKLGQIVRYATPVAGAAPKPSTLVWKYTYNGSGPMHPDGLSLDSDGNLYILSSKLSDSSRSAVYVLRANATSATGYDPAPLLIDSSCGYPNSLPVLIDSTVATTTTAAWNVGDLLVLVGSGNDNDNDNDHDDSYGHTSKQQSQASVLVYKQQSIAGVLAGHGARSGPDATLVGATQFSSSESPTGLDFWPADTLITHSTLLVSTDAGRILRFDFSGAGGATVPSSTVFASGLGSGLQKLKVGLQLEVPYAFLTQQSSSYYGKSQILQVAAPSSSGATNLVSAVSKGVNSPDAIAVARATAAPATNCLVPTSPPAVLGAPGSGCTLTGAMQHGIFASSPAVQAAISGNVVESTCVVLHDPRVSNGVCSGVTLDVSSVCPTFGHEIIPGTLCGSSGISGSGFALVRTDAPGVDVVPGLLVYGEETVDTILPATPPALNPGCPIASVAWVPRSDATPSEGSIVEIDPATGLLQLVELTGYCDSGGSMQRGMSIYGVGFTVNTPALSGGIPGFAQSKYNNLFATADAANIVPATKVTLETALGQINAYLANADYACAAAETVLVDGQVAADPNPAANFPGNGANPNPWGEIRGRLANLYYTLNTRLLLNPANTEWPLTHSSPPPCPPPVITLSAPANIAVGQTATIIWSTQHAASCQFVNGDAGWRAQTGVRGSYIASPIAPTTYGLVCQGAGGDANASVKVEVVPPPQVGFSASPASVTSGNESVTLNWTVTDLSLDGAANPVSCSVTANDGSVNLSGIAASGNRNIGPLTASQASTRTYTFSCKNSLGFASMAQTSVSIVPPAQIINFGASTSSVLSANVTSVTAGVDSVTLNWGSSGAAVCSLTGSGGVSSNLLAGPLVIGPIPGSVGGTATYQLICRNALGFPTPAATVVITVVPPAVIGTFSAGASTITSGDHVTLSWAAANATACAVSGGGVTTSVVGGIGSVSVTPGAGTTTFQLVCVNSLTTASAPLAVTVAALSPPTIGSFSASPSTLANGGGSSTLSWNAPGAASCSLTGGNLNASGTQGSVSTGPLTVTTTYTLTCGNALAGTPAGTALASISAQVTVQVISRVTAANLVGDLLYDVTAFAPSGPGATTALNTDGASHGVFTSLVYAPNSAGGMDVLVADAAKGQIVRYKAGSTTSTPVWSYGYGGGPAHPDGLSLDADGNLFIVTSQLSDRTNSSVWVLPASTGSATGFASAPLLIDSSCDGRGIQLLRETVVATTNTTAWSVGDLLVLVGNASGNEYYSDHNATNAEVFVYKRSTIMKVIATHSPVAQPDRVLMAPQQFPSLEFPVGMDFWPTTDSLSNQPTLLISTNLGRILRYDFSSGAPKLVQVFASGLGLGLQKVKVGQQAGVAYAFASQIVRFNGGRILKLGAPTQGTNLIGIAVTNRAADGLAVTH
jgi:hypothetical protein